MHLCDRQALSRADTLLSMKHGLVRLDNVWGVGGGLRPVKYLTRQMTLLLQEYLSSGDLQEATRCLLDLEVPHFHHELVYEVVLANMSHIIPCLLPLPLAVAACTRCS
jgi:programmed cell death protein 4